jgi:hypothetical protein
LERQLKATNFLSPIPPSPLAITVEALNLWVADNGKIWGTSKETADFSSTCESYATVPGDDPKCNIYVAEVIYLATASKVAHKAHEEKYVGIPYTGKYFPYRAAEWADTSISIPYFRVDNANPEMGDIWARGSHTGIYLGEYNGVELYISARFNGDGVYGCCYPKSIQYENGIQIKEPPKDDVVFQELCMSPKTSTISIKC